VIVGVPKETKPQEHRVALTPSGTHAFVGKGHRVLMQQGAGAGAGFPDEDYVRAGAEIVPAAEEVFRRGELILKVKEPLEPEYGWLRAGQILFTYLHIAPDPRLGRALIESGVTAVAYETVQLPDGKLPLLVPMSEVAGRMAIQVGAWALEKHVGGRGVLLAGIPGVRPARVAIVGGGVVGTNAAQMAVGLGADVVLLDINIPHLAQLDLAFHGRLRTIASNPHTLEEEVTHADLVIGAVLITGAETPHLVTRQMVRAMKPGSAIVDVDIDQGGCVETSRPTTHANPTYIEEGVVHYCVTNMPGAVARTSTFGLTNATLPYALRLADGGLEAIRRDPALGHGLNIHRGKVIHPAVARAMGVKAEALGN
jgi:alanine dehydrogenase